ncbi:hypothetical protein EUTSA_v10006996mg [Eutrema salsugineum]|uniref:K Homology domain-containing protein n=1 Tax=Eutrema salsugineum TaxID=72664 RepID=V4KVL5_EUTSA|nr:hypothetical protein EUTSA_v10006996mg [Eutrema salsugineum]
MVPKIYTSAQKLKAVNMMNSNPRGGNPSWHGGPRGFYGIPEVQTVQILCHPQSSNKVANLSVIDPRGVNPAYWDLRYLGNRNGVRWKAYFLNLSIVVVLRLVCNSPIFCFHFCILHVSMYLPRTTLAPNTCISLLSNPKGQKKKNIEAEGEEISGVAGTFSGKSSDHLLIILRFLWHCDSEYFLFEMASTLRNIHDHNVIGSEDTVYRYLCPVKKTGSIIGKGGEIAKQIRSETKSNMRINEALPGCEERVVTIYSTSEELNHFGEDGELVCPALDALFKVHDMIVTEIDAAAADDDDDEDDDLSEKQTVTVRMLVPSDQIGCVIGKGGQVIQNLRNETNAQIRVIKDKLPACALTLSHDELLQIIGEPLVVREALYQVASLLHDNPSRFQHSLLTSSSSMHQPGGMLMSAALTSSHRNYAMHRDIADAREFCVCFICPAENVGGVIGKGGGFINQIRQETGATIRVNTSETNEEDSIIFISSKEITGNPDAAMKALTQVVLRLRANSFNMDHGLVLLPTSFPYFSQVTESSSKAKYPKRDGSKDHDYSKLNSNSKRRNHVS